MFKNKIKNNIYISSNNCKKVADEHKAELPKYLRCTQKKLLQKKQQKQLQQNQQEMAWMEIISSLCTAFSVVKL